MGDVSSPAYPQLQPQQNALASNPAQAIGLMNGVNQLKLFNSQYPALSQIPAAELQTIKQQQQIQARQTISAAYSNAVAGLGPNASADDVRNISVNLARSYPDIATTYPDMIPAAKDVILNSRPGNFQVGANILRNSALSAGEGSSGVNVVDSSGAQYRVPLTSANMGGTVQTGLSPAVSAQISGPTNAYLADQNQSAAIQANLRKLQNVYPLMQELGNPNFGPGSAEFAKIKGALTTAGIIDPNTSDLKVRQEVGKYLLNYAQGAANAGRSDHALSTAIASNPNLDLTQPANLALIRNQIGMDRQDAAIPVLFNKLYPGDTDKRNYASFKANFYRDYDPRAFTYDMMSPQERRQVVDSLGPKTSPAFKKFSQTYSELKGTGFITPPNAQ